MKTESASELVDITGNNNATQEDVAKQPTLRMKTESRRETLDRLNEWEAFNQQTVFPYNPLSKAVKLANAQEELIEKMKVGFKVIAHNTFDIGIVDEANKATEKEKFTYELTQEYIALADAPYGGGE